MSDSPPGLERIQRWMQGVIMHPAGVQAGISAEEAQAQIPVTAEEIEKIVTRSQALSAVQRLEIYGGAYYARLLECLREEFPILRRALGQEAFDDFAFGYLQKYPSRSYTLGLLGVSFRRYLEETRPQDSKEEGSAAWPDFLIDLATLEWTYNEVFDGQGMEGQPVLDVHQLQAIAPERWPEARLLPVPCLRLLALRYPVHHYFAAARQEQEVDLPEPAPTFLAITRRDYVVQRHEISKPQHHLLSALVEGQSVGEAIGRAAHSAGADLALLARDLHAWFHDWAALGFFGAVKLPDAPRSPAD